MVDRKFATAQVKRLSGLHRFPKPITEDVNKAALSELVTVLTKCRTQAHAIAVIDEFVYGSIDCPTPSQLRECAFAKSESFRASATTRGCENCIDGWKQLYLLTTRTSNGYDREFITKEQRDNLIGKIDWNRQGLYEAVEPCECSPNVGRRLQ